MISMDYKRLIHRLNLLQHLRNRKIDGSRIYFGKFNQKLFNEIFGLVDIGCYTRDNKIFINGDVLTDDNLKIICATLSHEFLHMLLRWEHSTKTCKMLDKICSNTEEAHTECGGL